MKELYNKARHALEADQNVAAFFFHAGGTRLEHSLLGMYRALICDLMSQDGGFKHFVLGWHQDEVQPELLHKAIVPVGCIGSKRNTRGCGADRAKYRR
jgi:hypothetical protein